MPFELTEYTEATIKTVTNRVEKHGDEDKPAVTLGFEINDTNFILDHFDPTIRTTIFGPKGGEEQETVEGVPVTTPVLRCNSIESVKLPNKYDGWGLHIDQTGNEEDDFKLGSTNLKKFSFVPLTNGWVDLTFSASTNDVDAEVLGWLGMHIGEKVYIKLIAPKKVEKSDDVIDGTGAEFNEDHPLFDGTGHEVDAADVFAANESAGLNKDASEVPDAPKRSSNRPSLAVHDNEQD